jgi:chitinase
MNIPTLSRWALVLAAVAAAPALPAHAEDPATVVVTGTLRLVEVDGTVGADLAALAGNGEENAWTLTMVGTSYVHEHQVNRYFTRITAASIDLSFSGPDADVLNAVVGAGVAGGEAIVELRNTYQSGGDWSDMALWVVPAGYSGVGVTFFAGHELVVNSTLFPADAQGYPVVTSDPYAFRVEETAINDYRSGNGGVLWSWEDTATISGDEGSPLPPTISIADASVVEGNRGTTQATLAVRLANSSASTITVKYRTVAGTAAAKSDFKAASGTLTFQPGQTVLTLSVGIKGDRSREPDETFTVVLYDAVGSTSTDATAVVTIRNDD